MKHLKDHLSLEMYVSWIIFRTSPYTDKGKTPILINSIL